MKSKILTVSTVAVLLFFAFRVVRTMTEQTPDIPLEDVVKYRYLLALEKMQTTRKNRRRNIFQIKDYLTQTKIACCQQCSKPYLADIRKCVVCWTDTAEISEAASKFLVTEWEAFRKTYDDVIGYRAKDETDHALTHARTIQLFEVTQGREVH